MSFLDAISYEIFQIIILPGVIYYYYDSMGQDIAIFMDTWTYYICVFQYVFINDLNHRSMTFKQKFWGRWKEFRDYWIVCVGVFLLGWFCDWIGGNEDANNDARLLENFQSRAKISS